jgi:hypothetical protein
MLSFTYTYVISNVESNCAGTPKYTITVGEGLIASSFNPSHNSLYEATEIPGNVSIVET